MLTLCNLCVFCIQIDLIPLYSNYIFKLCIMIVHSLKICIGDAGPEQSFVLFVINYQKLIKIKNKVFETYCLLFQLQPCGPHGKYYKAYVERKTSNFGRCRIEKYM